MMTTVAYNAGTGREIWSAHESSDPPSQATSSALSPDGRVLFVSGLEEVTVNINSPPMIFPLTVAYSTQTGHALWKSLYGYSGQVQAKPEAITVSPRGDRVFVTGLQGGGTSSSSYFTAAYAAQSGALLWSRSYFGLVGGKNHAVAVAVDPRGDRVFVTGFSQHPSPKVIPLYDFATIAYSARSGQQLWVARYTGGDINLPTQIAVSPKGDRVFVTGAAQYGGSDTAPLGEYATVAYAANSGKRLWVATYVPSAESSSVPTALVPNSTGTAVYVTGISYQLEQYVPGVPAASSRYVAETDTVAYTATGQHSWVSRYAPAGEDASYVPDIAYGGKLTRLYVATSFGPENGTLVTTCPAVVSYAPKSGAQLWVARYDFRHPPELALGEATAVGVSPHGNSVFEAVTSLPLFGVVDPPLTSPASGLLLRYQS